MKVTVLRLAPLLGPGVHTFYTRIFDHRVVPVLMGYDPLVQLLHPEDALDALRARPRAGARGRLQRRAPRPIPLAHRAPPGREGPGARAAPRRLRRRRPAVGGGAGRRRPGGFVDYARYPVRGRRREGASASWGSRRATRAATRSTPTCAIGTRRAPGGPGRPTREPREGRSHRDRRGAVARRPASKTRRCSRSACARACAALERESRAATGLLVALARLLAAGCGGLDLGERGARLVGGVYFSWHSEEWTSSATTRSSPTSVRPFFEFLYTVWWRVEAAGVENVPGEGPALIVANHSGVLPYDGMMINLAVRHEHPARRECRMLALDMFALLPVPGPAARAERRGAGEPGERRAAAAQGRARRRLPRGREGRGQALQEPLQARPLRPRRLRAPGPAHGRAHRPVRGRGRRGDPPDDRRARLAGPAASACRTSRSRRRSRCSARSGSFRCPPSGRSTSPTHRRWTPTAPRPPTIPILVNRLSEQVRSTIQRMIDGRLARRRSVWFG